MEVRAAEEATQPVAPSTAGHIQDQAFAALEDIVFGSLAGIVGKFAEYPFDLVKVRLQSQPSTGLRRYAGPLDCFSQSVRQDGFLSLYRGVSAPLFGAAIENSCLFFSYRLAQDAIRATYFKTLRRDEALPLSALCSAGAASGAVTSIVLTPIELVKCKMQVQPGASSANAAQRPGPMAIVASVFREQGILGFWRGQLGTLIRETGGSAAWFGSYEGVSLYFRRQNGFQDDKATLPIWQQLLAGAVAGMSYNFLFYPADTIKSRMQTEESVAAGAKKVRFLEAGRGLWRDRGLRGLYSGCGITVARSAPSSALIFLVYQTLLREFGSRQPTDS